MMRSLLAVFAALYLSTPIASVLFRGGVQDQSIEAGRPVQGELSGGESHSYRLAIRAGQRLQVTVTQAAIDAIVELFGPGDEKLGSAENPNWRREENLSMIAESDGTYRVEIRSRERPGVSGGYEVQLAEIKAASAEDRSLAEALRFFNDSLRLSNETKYDEATVPAERALKIAEGSGLQDRPEAGTVMNYVAWLYDRLGRHDEAGRLYDRTLKFRERLLGPDHLDVAETLNSMGWTALETGNATDAEQLFQRALAIRERMLGAEHLLVSESLHGLAFLYRNGGDFVKAEPLFQRMLAIREKLFGTEHPKVAITLDDMGYLYNLKADYVRAEALLLRALEIQQRTLAPTDPDLAFTLNDVATLYRNMKAYGKAETYYLRSVDVEEKALGPDHPDFARYLDNLARVYMVTGQYAKAEPLHRRTLAILEKAFGGSNPDVATALANLADVYFRQQKLADAKPLFERAAALHEGLLGTHHPDVVNSLGALASVYRATGEVSQAIAVQSRANGLSELNLNRNLGTGSERQKLAYLSLFTKGFDFTLSLHNQTAPDNVEALNLAVATLLRRKGRGLDAMVDTIGTLRQHAKPQDQALFDQLLDARKELAASISQAPGEKDVAGYKSHIRSIEDRVDLLEEQISARNGESSVELRPLTVAAVQAQIPAKAVLLEIALYHPSEARTQERQPARYAAYLLARQGNPRWVDLGDAATIDRGVESLRRALRNPDSTDVRRRARALDEAVMRPIRKLIGDVRNILLSPDGALNLIPFGALVDERDHYLIENYSFNYLASGRDLLRLSTHFSGRQGPVVVFDARFDLPDGATSAPSQINARRSTEFTRANFEPLPGTAAEGKALGATLTDATLLSGAQATEATIKQVHGPRILHVATHGFFLTSKPDNEPATENPLLRSGLILAGANQRRSGAGEDGVLTALEVAGLDLWGTKLVVLSACDTGLGDIKDGEGVFGLRRALVLAGSESQVMSLWQVSDDATQELMVGYYTALARGQGRSEGLRAVQLKMLRAPGRTHPYYWAAFIASGEWANLDGRR